jgi:plasmid stabilization system protein ParE
MTYRIELAASALTDIRDATRWLRDEASPAAADKWLTGLFKAITSLEKQPLRCPLAAENDNFPQEIRELLYGRRKKYKHRIVFEIIEDVVYVLYIRHTARDELEP